MGDDSVTIEMNADGSLSCPDLGLRCKPPGHFEIRSDGSGPAIWALFMTGRTLSPELISDLIDTYEFCAKTMPGTPIVIGTG